MKHQMLLALVFSLLGGTHRAIAEGFNPVENSGQSEQQIAGQIRDSDLQIQHEEYIGQCRQANRALDIYSMPSIEHGSDRVTVLAPNTRVTLTGWGGYGWVQINSPVEGYAIVRHLKYCGGNQVATPLVTNPTSGNNCRVAIRDLAIRDRPTKLATPVGGIGRGSAMTLTGSNQLDSVTGRVWLEVSEPATGWISGGVSGASNIRFCR
ncbi:hypothetical protein IQ249_19000 [Lusitaniella coriacea LEGE 07157]|uniref:SH3 domain-containing protein n=1 Tax=Lusitaniella coriacea LEGE 07157 TaxID=945747 RepID=A0A8J7JDK9_9CYAN|nr:hypothetical protein [Lusitaniella coriacea]MBE9117990.1 hypothetical protein [Lusitaniella coriacea LEGE 07157]